MTEVQKQARIPKLHELIGRIRGKEKVKVYGKSKWAGTYYYKLEVNIENKEVEGIFAFKDRLISERIWKDLEESNYVDKRFLFYCMKSSRGFGLINWKELKND